MTQEEINNIIDSTIEDEEQRAKLKKELNPDKILEMIKKQVFIHHMFYSDEIVNYTEDEEELKQRKQRIINAIEMQNNRDLLADKQRLLNNNYYLDILASCLTLTENDPMDFNKERINDTITDYDYINTFFNDEGENAYNILEEYDGEIITKDSKGYYILSDKIVNKVINDNEFFITDDKTRKTIKDEIFNTWENQKQLINNESLNDYSEKRNGINFKHFIFCEQYLKSGKITTTCNELGIARNTAYLWLKDKKVQEYLENRQNEIKKETDQTFLNTYMACFNELNKMINSRGIDVNDKIKAIDTFLKHYTNMEKLKQPPIQNGNS